jgi:hypothetical protein
VSVQVTPKITNLQVWCPVPVSVYAPINNYMRSIAQDCTFPGIGISRLKIKTGSQHTQANIDNQDDITLGIGTCKVKMETKQYTIGDSLDCSITKVSYPVQHYTYLHTPLPS